jgi:hypothetical protein
MKKSIFILAITMFIAGTIFTGCQSSADKVQDAKDNVAAAKQELIQARIDSIKQFKKESAEEISHFEKSLAEFKAGIANQKKENKALYENKLAELEQQKSDLKRKLEEYNEDKIDQWNSFRAEFSHDMDELGKAFSDFTVKNNK